MNEEQIRKAEEIVKNSTVKEIEKKYALYEHLATIEEVEKYKLPYRVLIDQKKNIIGKGYTQVSDTYPLPGYPKADRPIFNYPIDYIDDNPTYKGADSEKLKDANKQVLLSFIDKYRHDWSNADTNEWDYYLIHLLANYDFDSFTVFDFYGENKEIPQADLDLLRKYYKRKQKQFTDNPSKYFNNEPTYTNEERKKYSFSTHLVKYSDEVIKKYDEETSNSDSAKWVKDKYGNLKTSTPSILENGLYVDYDFL